MFVEDGLLNATEVAQRLCVSPSTVNRLARAGDITFVEVRGTRRFSSRAVERFLSRQTRTAKSELSQEPWADYLRGSDEE